MTASPRRADLKIISETLEKHYLHSSKWGVPFLLRSHIGYLEKEVPVASTKHLKTGVRELLDQLSTTPGIGMGLLTGNIKDGARKKLEPF